MRKVLGSWSRMRKYLEQDMLAESMKGRIRYNCTTYAGMDDCKIFEIFLDGKLFKQFSWETVQSYFHRTGIVPRIGAKFISSAEYWYGFWKTLAKIPVCERTEYTDDEFCTALEAYRNKGISDSQVSSDPIQKMFAVLDRRTGKRALLKMKEDSQSNPDWLTAVLTVRMEADGFLCTAT